MAHIHQYFGDLGEVLHFVAYQLCGCHSSSWCSSIHSSGHIWTLFWGLSTNGEHTHECIGGCLLIHLHLTRNRTCTNGMLWNDMEDGMLWNMECSVALRSYSDCSDPYFAIHWHMLYLCMLANWYSSNLAGISFSAPLLPPLGMCLQMTRNNKCVLSSIILETSCGRGPSMTESSSPPKLSLLYNDI